MRRAAYAAALLAVFAGIWLLTAHTPRMMDDYDYSFNWATGEPLAGLFDVIASQAAHYMIWGGRCVVHALAQLFLYIGKGAFNVANAAVYALMIAMMLTLADGRGGAKTAGGVLLCHMLLMALTPFFGTVFLWLDGACNYLWGTVLALMPLMILQSALGGGFFAKAGRGCAALGAAMCFIAGWTNENTACGVFAAVLLHMIYERMRGGKIAARRVVCLIAQGLGIAVMLLAPGNFARAAGEQTRGFAMEMIYRLAVVTYCGLRYCGIPIAGAAVLMLMLKRKGAAIALDRTLTLLGAAVLSGYALIGSPVISDRSFTASVVLCIAAAAGLLHDVLRAYDVKKKTRAAGAAAAFVLCAAAVWYAAGQVTAHEAAWNAQLEKIEAAKAAGESRVTVESVLSGSRFAMDIALGDGPADWPNSTLSRAMDIEIAGE